MNWKSLPQVVSELVKMIDPHERADELLKEEVAHLCNLIPHSGVGSLLTSSLTRLAPSWVITTNYDLIIEALLDNAVSVLPDQPLVARPDRIPVYHLHGHRISPSSIKITEEDYVGLLGPIDYPRLKLPLILLESTTLMLGYSFGDINVRAARAWSSSFKGSRGVQLSPEQGVVIQALYTEGRPLEDLYPGPNGEWVLEISDLCSFLKELADRREQIAGGLAEAQYSLEQFLLDPAMAAAVANQGLERDEFLEIIEKSLPFARATSFIKFLNGALDPVWEKARENKQFAYYDTYLRLLMDILERIQVGQCSPALIGYLADALNRVGWYTSRVRENGTAWDASRTWLLGHNRISEGVKAELKSCADVNGKQGLQKMLSLV